MAFVLEEKATAEKETEAAGSISNSHLTSAKELMKEIEEANEERVLVELARLKAVREFGEIEAQREAEAAQFSKAIEEAKTRIRNMGEEINHAKVLELKLAVTNSDLSVLQSEMELIRAMKKKSQNKHLMYKVEESKEEELPRVAETDLETAKKGLECIKEEAFQLMASMDVAREELKQVSKETARLKKIEEETDLTVQNLNSNLLRANAKLEAASMAKEKTRAIASNLLVSLQWLQSETEAAKKEKEIIARETESIKVETEIKDLGIEFAEDRLQSAMQELEAVKSSEAIVIDRLRTLANGFMRTRAPSYLQSPTITISDYEYKYLIKHGEEAQHVADKKVVAALALVEAFKAGEKEILMKTEIARREIRKLRIAQDKELHGMVNSLGIKKALDEGQREVDSANLQLGIVSSRKSFREIGNSRRANVRRQSLSYGKQQNTRRPSITLKRRKKVVPNLLRFLRR